MDINFRQKLRLFKEYKDYIRINRSILMDNNFRVDNAYRLYTVVNISEQNIPEPYRLRVNDVVKIEEKYVAEALEIHRNFFNKIGLNGLFSEPIVRRIQPLSYLVYYNYKYLDNVKYQFVKYGLYGIFTLTLLGLIFKILI